MCSIFSKQLKVNETFFIATDELKVAKNNPDNLFKVPIPMSHIGLKKIQCRLMSSKLRKGMVCKNYRQAQTSFILILNFSAELQGH